MADSHSWAGLELRQLEAFVRVAEHGSFTRAAELLQTDQPTVSRLVRRLEVQLHHALLVRNGRGAVPTPAGELLLAHGREILQRTRRARDALEQLRPGARRKFTLGLVPNVARFAALALVRDMREQFPQTAITVIEGPSTALLEALLKERADAAILYETPGSAAIERRRLLREELYLVGPAAPGGAERSPGRLRFRDVSRFPLISTGRTHAIREVIETQATAHQVKLNIALEVDAMPSLLDLVEEGFGHALLPLNAIVRDERRRKLTLSRVTDPTLYCDLVLATSRSHPPTGFAQSAISLLEERIVPLCVAHESDHATRALMLDR